MLRSLMLAYVALKRSVLRTGRILNALEERGLTNTTFTYFTSDHGGHLEARSEHGQLGGWNGIYRGKTDGPWG